MTRQASLISVIIHLTAIGVASIANAGAPAPSWKLVRPTNTGILGDYVHTIFVDEQDHPWVAAYTPFWEEGGMSMFDGTKWTVVSSVDHSVIASPRFNDIVKDASGIMWIATDAGLLKYDPAIGPSSLVRYDQSTAPIPTSQMNGLALAPDGTLWMALYHTPTGAGGLARFQPSTGQWQTWTSATGLPWGTQWPGWNAVAGVAVTNDADGGYTVWFESNALGVATYKEGVFDWFGVPSEIISDADTLPMSIPSNNPADADGNIWLGTNHGLSRRNSDGSWTMAGYPFGLSSEVSVVFALQDGRAALGTFYSDVFTWDGAWSYLGNWGGTHTYAFAEDSQGRLWTGGIGGSAVYNQGFWQRYRLTNTGMLGFWITTIAFDADGNVYMDANAGPGVGGFDVLHPDDTWSNANDLTYGLGLPWGLPTDDVADMVIRANGRPLLALNGIQGAVEFTGDSYTYLIPQGYDIVKIAEDGLGRVWAARYDNGVILVTGTQMTFFNPSTSPLPIGQVTDIILDPDDPTFVWIVAPAGLVHTNGTTWDVYPRELLGLTQWSLGYFITSGDRAPDGTFWLGSGVGLFHFDPATKQYTTYTPATTTLASDDIQRIEVAPDGSVWVSTMDDTWPYPGGLSHFDGETWTTYSQGSSPLPHNQVWALNSRPTADGGYEVWVGTASEAIAVVTVPPPASAADLDGDGDVDGFDLASLLAAWGTCGAGACTADLDGNGTVNGFDLAILLAAWG